MPGLVIADEILVARGCPPQLACLTNSGRKMNNVPIRRFESTDSTVMRVHRQPKPKQVMQSQCNGASYVDE